MRSIFVAGTDTGVGKTVVAGCLAKYWAGMGLKTITQKWAQTGVRANHSCDIDFHLKMMGKSRADIRDYRHAVMPYAFAFPASAHLASRVEHKTIKASRIKSSFRALASSFDRVIVEGTGGLLVPYDQKHFLIDIAQDLKLPVLLVAENKLGVINHTLLSLEALRQRKMRVVGVVFNNLVKCDARILQDNPRVIKVFSGARVLGVMPKARTQDELYRNFVPIAKKICEGLT
ncbi:MAG: dethiobiotin synthase [Candidatus Omnitrophota bacterium]